MREILFRGKRVDNGEWVYGLFAKCKVRNLILPCIQREHENDSGDYIEIAIVNGETLGQYTGIADTNGNKIFEGDVAVCQGGEYYHGTWEYESTEIVKDIRSMGFLEYCEKAIVIGNIHDEGESDAD